MSLKHSPHQIDMDRLQEATEALITCARILPKGEKYSLLYQEIRECIRTLQALHIHQEKTK